MSKKIICHDLNNKEFEVNSDKFIFRPAVYGILIEDNKVLLSKQWDGYDFPGGGVDIHETVEETLEREFFEETGIKVKAIMPIHCGTSFFHPKHSKKNANQYWNCPFMYFLVKKVGGELSIENLDEEEKEYASMPEWIDLDKIDNLKFYNSIKSGEVIKKALDIKNKLGI